MSTRTPSPLHTRLHPRLQRAQVVERSCRVPVSIEQALRVPLAIGRFEAIDIVTLMRARFGLIVGKGGKNGD